MEPGGAKRAKADFPRDGKHVIENVIIRASEHPCAVDRVEICTTSHGLREDETRSQ